MTLPAPSAIAVPEPFVPLTTFVPWDKEHYLTDLYRAQTTFFMVKPDAVERRLIGFVLERIESIPLAIRALRYLTLTREQASLLYAPHASCGYFKDLIAYTISGPVVVGQAYGEAAVARWRNELGATDPKLAKPGTVRRMWGETIRRNVAHGSSSEEEAMREIEAVWGKMGAGAMKGEVV